MVSLIMIFLVEMPFQTYVFILQISVYGDGEQFCTEESRKFIDADTRPCQSSSDKPQSNIERFFCNCFEKKLRSETISVNSNQFRCHRGIALIVWRDFTKNISSEVCLCPLMYFGPQCRYQNQHASLTAKFRALFDSWQTFSVIVFTLVDRNFICIYFI